MKYLGIDIGGTEVKMGIVTDGGEILCRNNYSVSFDGYETPILTTVLKSVDVFFQENKIDKSSLGGIGVSATGQIDTRNGIVAGVAGHIKNWLGTNIKEALEEKYNLPTSVVNDANCVAIGEQWIGGAKDVANVVVITIGTGVGGGVIVDSNILLGGIGIAGELGHFSIRSKGILCACGNRGCYEKYASMTALVNMVKEELDLSDVNGKMIFDWIRQGNEKIEVIVDQWIESIITGLVNLTHIFNPDKILIGGGVSVQEDLFVYKVRQGVLKRVMPEFSKNLSIEAAALGNDAGMVGAVRYLIKNS